MQLVNALLCDFAKVRDNLLYVLGGGITRVWLPQLPAALGVSLALALEVSREEATIPHEVHVVLTSPGGDPVAEAMAGLQLDPTASRLETGEAFLVPLALALQSVGVREYGRYVAAIDVDTKPLGRTQFWVLHPEERMLPPLS